ncbi:ATP-binding protein [Sphingomonas sp. 28-63-12]|uniref:ATP-binding protein n=1 Tax=Sphingomonas sp. 28-63-12 TaxID=1970434 RepID=UPI000BD251B9|nr:MAG: two-component sensor histidine kinase [Sphingomonas sp. 28-63-12]
MSRFTRASPGLLGQIVAILLLTVIIEFGVSTLLYERASQFSVRDDEAHRLAEHLAISRRLVSARPIDQRSKMAAALTTDHYLIRWTAALPAPPPIAPAMDAMRRQVLIWEPALADADLRFNLASPGRESVVTGGLQLADHSWLYFRTRAPIAELNLATERILLALAPAIALVLMAGLLMQRTLQPLRRLATAADEMGSGVEIHVEEAGPTDVARVIRAFNGMQVRIHGLIHDRTQALFAVGHDLRTPLSRLKLRADAVGEQPVRNAIRADIDEMEAMVASLLAYLGGDENPEAPSRVDLAVHCATIADDAIDHGGKVIYVGPDHLDATIRRSGFKRAITNLVDNGRHHGSTVVLTLEEKGDTIRVYVDDDGPGIPPDKLADVLKPFVRLDTARQRDTIGFGLGLAIVLRAVEHEGGQLTLSNRSEGGLRAEICLPKSQTVMPLPQGSSAQ